MNCKGAKLKHIGSKLKGDSIPKILVYFMGENISTKVKIHIRIKKILVLYYHYYDSLILFRHSNYNLLSKYNNNNIQQQ